MKKITYCLSFIFLSLFFHSPLRGEEELQLPLQQACIKPACKETDKKYTFELRMAGFIPRSSRFRDIYCDMGANYQAEASIFVYDCYYGWLNFDWFSKRGHSNLGYSSRISLANTSFGARVLHRFDEQFSGYIGLGASVCNVWIENRDVEFRERVSKVAYGLVLKSGFYYFINSRLYVDIFFDYLYQPVRFHSYIDMGGAKIGAGLGIKF